MPRIVPSQLKDVIREQFAGLGSGHNLRPMAGHAAQAAAIVDLFYAIPTELLGLPTKDYAQLIAAVSQLRMFVEDWKARSDLAEQLQKHVLEVMIEQLGKCPDEVPASVNPELRFIDQEDLRESLLSDLGGVRSAVINQEWRAATILGGALVEALLLWKIQSLTEETVTEKNIDRSDVDHWDLEKYIRTAWKARVISLETKAAAMLARDFRNLIHPGFQARKRQKCTRATAYTAIAAVEHVIDDLAASRGGV